MLNVSSSHNCNSSYVYYVQCIHSNCYILYMHMSINKMKKHSVLKKYKVFTSPIIPFFKDYSKNFPIFLKCNNYLNF